MESIESKMLNEVMLAAYDGGFTIQSDFARMYAREVAALACTGMITTKGNNMFGRIWRITARGLQTLESEGWV